MSAQTDEKKGFSWLSLFFAPYYYAGYGQFSKGLLFAIIGFIPLTQIIVNIYAGVKAKKELPIGKLDFKWGASISVLVVHSLIQGSVFYFSLMNQQETNGIGNAAAYIDTQIENTLAENASSGNGEHINTDLKIGQDYLETEAKFLGYAEVDWGCMSDFVINGEKVVIEGCPGNKSIYEKNIGKILKLRYNTGMVEGFKTFYFVDVAEIIEKEKQGLETIDKYNSVGNEDRIYASLVMDASIKDNEEALSKLKQNNNTFAGLAVSVKANQSDLINKITLKSPTDSLVGVTYGHAFGQKFKTRVWSIEKIEEAVNKLKSKYQKVDSKEEVEEFDLATVRDAIYEYHNSRDQPSQAEYNRDIKNSEAIKNLKSVFIFDNQGDRITVTVKICLEGKGNTNLELLYGVPFPGALKIYQNSLTIEYESKNLVELARKNKEAQISEERAKAKKATSELESL